MDGGREGNVNATHSEWGNVGSCAWVAIVLILNLAVRSVAAMYAMAGASRIGDEAMISGDRPAANQSLYRPPTLRPVPCALSLLSLFLSLSSPRHAMPHISQPSHPPR